MNILFITADQWRGDCLSALGHPHVRTPNLDAIAADGVTCKHHYAQATPCGPARACIYTGMYLHNHRSVLNGTPLDGRHTNLALEVRKSGYKPALFGYTDVSLDPRQFAPGDYAVETYEGVLPGFVPVSHVNSAAKPWLADLKAKGYQVPEHAREILSPQAGYPGAADKGKTFAPAKFKAEDSRTAHLRHHRRFPKEPVLPDGGWAGVLHADLRQPVVRCRHQCDRLDPGTRGGKGGLAEQDR